jgi:hypothetical protein
MMRTLNRYPQSTASTQADTEAPASSGASVSFLSEFPAGPAACADAKYAGLDWVPAREGVVVPDAQQSACGGCPLRLGCLQWAVEHGEAGYWAGTTSRDREQLAASGRVTLGEADRLQAIARGDDEAMRNHPDEGPSMRWYRRGCGCGGCRALNAAVKQSYRHCAA